MPYGKGTYGTKRGRPPVKKKVKKLARGGTFKAPHPLTPKAIKLKRDNEKAERELLLLDRRRRLGERPVAGPEGPAPASPAPRAGPEGPASPAPLPDMSDEELEPYDNFPKTYSMKKGGALKKKKAVKKMKHGGKVGKCPRDGIAIRGKTRG